MSDQVKLTYGDSGVPYEDLDAFKVLAQDAARRTAANLNRFPGFHEVPWSRGESAYLIETPWCYLAHVEEGLGTKVLVADELFRDLGASYYSFIAQDTVAMIVNDMLTLGAMPLSIAMHLAVGDADWLTNQSRNMHLVSGWKYACDLAGASWGCGETPALTDIVYPHTAVLSGSAMGIVMPKGNVIKTCIQHDDAIVIVRSNGIHANGLSLARRVAAKLPRRYETQMPDGRTFGEALLQPTPIYRRLIEACLKSGLDIHALVNITGHGWRKLMRAQEPFVYVVETLPEPQAEFLFMQQEGPIDDEEAYRTFNMGAGFAFIIPAKEVEWLFTMADAHEATALCVGHVEKCGDEKRVEILPKNIVYHAKELQIR